MTDSVIHLISSTRTWPRGATSLRCGGCGKSDVLIQGEPSYGQMVRDFLDQHDQCGGAVDISAARPPADQAADHLPLSA